MNGLRFRVFVGGALKHEEWLEIEDMGQTRGEMAARAIAAVERHAQIAFSEPGRPWMIEVYDPDQPPDRAYTRLGTDLEGMVDPRPFGA
jgi:hypothetical protein